jgi:FkbM family methyltransferase
VPSLKQVVRATIPRWLRNWLKAPGKSLHWGWQQARFYLGARQVVELRPGWKLTCHPLAYQGAYHAHVDDPEQAAELDSFLSRCTPGMVLFDLGAHFGLFSFAALHRGGEAAKAVAVDASPTAVRMVETQARLNGVAGRLTAIRACVCDEDGVREMVEVGVLANGYFTAPTGDHPSGEVAATPAVSLDGLARRVGLRPTHVKIDVEGYEGEVLRGGAGVLKQGAPLLFLELHNAIIRERGQDPADVLKTLEQAGYSLVGLDGQPLRREAVLAPPLIRLVAKPSLG